MRKAAPTCRAGGPEPGAAAGRRRQPSPKRRLPRTPPSRRQRRPSTRCLQRGAADSGDCDQGLRQRQQNPSEVSMSRGTCVRCLSVPCQRVVARRGGGGDPRATWVGRRPAAALSLLPSAPGALSTTAGCRAHVCCQGTRCTSALYLRLWPAWGAGACRRLPRGVLRGRAVVAQAPACPGGPMC